jgi:hypothetical protein
MTWPRRKSIYIILIIVLVALLPVLVQKGLGNAYHFKSRFYIEQWQQGAQPTSLQYANALLAADYAYSIDDQHPHYLLTLAKVMEWGVFTDLGKHDHSVFNHLYRTAINQRPTWPNAYSDYAYNLAFIQHDLAAAWPQLLQARHYGPYTPEVVHQILAIGFAYWPSLTVTQKQLVFTTAKIAASAHWSMRNDLKQLTHQYQLTPIMCSYFKFSPQDVEAKNDKWIKQDLCR